MEGDGVGYLMQAMCWCNGLAGHVPRVQNGPRKGSLKTFLRLEGWHTPLEGLEVWNHTLHT